jgi:glutaminyl-tRNA synthetase
LYEWFLKALNLPRRHPRQIEFARLNLTYTVMSKRKLLRLVKENYVNGWDDPRMPTICGLRRRGYTPESLRNFAERIGIARRENVIDVSLLEFCVREDLNKKVPRVLGVLKPLKVVLTNYPADLEDELEAIINPENPDQGSRKVPFSGELYIDQDDFMENPPKGYFRLSPGAEVRLRYGYFIRCTDVIKDSTGNISEIHCTYDPESRGGQSPDGRKVKGTIHWVSAKHAIKAEVKLYDRLFVSENPEDGSEGSDFISNLNPRSLETVEAFIEPWAAGLQAGQSCQFERLGYFCVDTESRNGKMIFNRTVTLKDTWTKISGKA